MDLISMQLISMKTDKINNKNNGIMALSVFSELNCAPNNNVIIESSVRHFEVHITQRNIRYLRELINACLMAKTTGIISKLYRR